MNSLLVASSGIEELKRSRERTNIIIEEVIAYLAGEGKNIRIKSCATDDPKEVECPMEVDENRSSNNG